MAPVREALERFLAGHEPYPAVVVDRHWNIVASNRGVAYVTRGVAAELRTPPANALRIALHPDGLAPRIMVMHELHLDETDLALFCSFATFGTARDLTLAELTIVAFYPADAQTAEALSAAVGEPQPD